MLLKFTDPSGIAREMDRLFESMVASQPYGFVPGVRGQWRFPAINLWEDADNLYAEAELPGFSMNDIEVLVTDGELTLRGTRTVQVPEEARALRRERVMGEFERTVGLPAAIDTDHVEAKLVNGILTITLPKTAASKPRRIDVKTLSEA